MQPVTVAWLIEVVMNPILLGRLGPVFIFFSSLHVPSHNASDFN